MIPSGDKNEKAELSQAAGGRVKWYSHFGENSLAVSYILNIHLPYGSIIPLPDIYLRNKHMSTQRLAHKCS